MNRIACKYNNIIIAPDNAFGNPKSETYLTTDGKYVSVKWISCWDNTDGQYDKILDDECVSLWGVRFAALKSLWISRLGACSGHWHKVELTVLPQ